MTKESSRKQSPHPKNEPTPAEVSNRYGLLCYDQLPDWRKDNPYIWTQYRPISHSFRQCIASLGYLHNQTGNIYSHLLFLFPALAMSMHCSLVLGGFRESLTSPRHHDLLAFGSFFAGAMTCMGFSSFYHTFMNHSEGVAKRGKQLDFAGITCLIWGSFMPTLYYCFTCEADLMKMYMTIFSTIGAMSLVFLLSPLAQNPSAQKLVVPLFVTFAASGLFPLWHGIKLYGYDRMNQLTGLEYVLAHGALYLLALTPYLTQFPERFFPGKCDIWFSSHQLFHVGVVMAACVHLAGLLKAYYFQQAHYQAAICPLLNTWKGDLLHVV
ncbi:HlyIII-domain-containing protein [Stemphylium lycopersici]|uniref:HlyIII-domain-containing protein n=1 Tax=Stemphylium lycopersici TaxID=183478 RepID=A0A364N9F8_STELY|nr:HlyIII-domain-containing protein [Stemphylium lycopersici]